MARAHFIDIEPAGCSATGPRIVILRPQLVPGQGGVEHIETEDINSVRCY